MVTFGKNLGSKLFSEVSNVSDAATRRAARSTPSTRRAAARPAGRPTSDRLRVAGQGRTEVVSVGALIEREGATAPRSVRPLEARPATSPIRARLRLFATAALILTAGALAGAAMLPDQPRRSALDVGADGGFPTGEPPASYPWSDTGAAGATTLPGSRLPLALAAVGRQLPAASSGAFGVAPSTRSAPAPAGTLGGAAVRSGARGGVGPAVGAVVGGVGGVVGGVGGVVGGVGGVAEGATGTVGDVARGGGKVLGDTVGTLGKVLPKPLGEPVEELGEVVQDTTDGLGEVVEHTGEAVGGLVSGLGGLVSGLGGR